MSALLVLVFLLRSRVIYFYASTRAQSSQYFVTAGNDFVTRFQAAQDFDIRSAGDAGLYRQKLGFAGSNHEDSLDFFFVHTGRVGCLRLRRSGLD